MTRFSTHTAATIAALLLGSSALAAPAPQINDTPTSAAAVAPTFSAAQVRADIRLARSAYEDIHPGYTRFTSKAALDAAWDAILTRSDAQGGLSEAALYLAISETLALIHCDHTKAELSKTMKASRETKPVYLPLRWTIVDGRALIEDAPKGSPLTAGDEILTIDGRSIPELQAKLHPFIPFDGYNDHTRDSQMTASLEFMGGAVDHFGAFLWAVPRTAELNVSSAIGERRTVELDRVTHGDWMRIAVDDKGLNFKDAVSLTPVGERGAVLRVDSFVNYREPVDPDDIYGPVFEQLRQQGRDQLILDLRRNGGGSTDASQGLFAYLIDSKRKMKTAQIMRTLDHSAYEDHIQTWDKRAINPSRFGFRKTDNGEYALRGAFTEDTDTIKPARAAFKGELTVLTSRNNSSGSTNLIAALRHARAVTLIGEQTGGNPAGPTAGSIFFLKLPESGMVLRLPVFRYVNNSGKVADGVGLIPDIAAPDTVESLREDRDPAMEAALAKIAT